MRKLRGEILEPRWVLDSVVVLNELMYHPANGFANAQANGDTRGEWLELRNLLSTDVDLSQWSLQGGIEYTFPTGTTIAADGYLLVVADPAAWRNAAITQVVGPWSGSLANEGERIELRKKINQI